MFGDPLLNTMGWRTSPLSDLFPLISRGKQPSYLETSTVKVVNQACVYWNAMKWENVKFHNPDSPKKTLKLEDGCILINSTGTGTLGRCAVFQQPKDTCTYIADSHVTVLSGSNSIDPLFFWCFFWMEDTQKKIYAECVNGSTNQIELSKEKLGQIELIVPPLDLQKRFAAFVRQSDKSKYLTQKIIRMR